MFMRGKDGKNLEESILDKFAELDKISRVTRKNEEQIRKMNKRIRKNYQKHRWKLRSLVEKVGVTK